jgi:signal transduction histidine kinase
MVIVLILVVIILAVRLHSISRSCHDLVVAIENRRPLLLEYDARILYGNTTYELLVATNELISQNVDLSRRLKEGDQQISAVLERLCEAVLVIDEEMYVVDCNYAFRSWVDDPTVDYKALSLDRLLRGVELMEWLSQLKAQGSLSSSVIRCTCRNKDVYLKISGSCSRESSDFGGKQFLIVLHDITREKELELIRTDFVANVSHELRTPVTIIRGFTEALIDDYDRMPEALRREFLGKVGRNVKRLHSLLDDLLTLSRIESSSEDPLFEEASLYDVCADLRSQFIERCEARQVKFVEDFADGLKPVRLNALRISRVIENLIENALLHAKGLTVLTLELRAGELEYTCSVKDDGCGIPESEHSRIFERFYRVDKGRSRDQGGTGLGLSIVKHVIQQHGGRVFVESRYGQGCRIGFCLPNGDSQSSPDI